MSESFREQVALLVQQCEGNQAEAARRMGISPSFITNVLKGRGPEDPRTETWTKLRQALGAKAPPWMVAEGRAVYAAMDRFDNLAQFVKGLPEDQQNIFIALAEGLGWQDPAEPGGG